MSRNRLIVVLAPLTVVVVITAAALWSFFLQPELPAAERGRRVAEREGCFTCHGPSGMGGVPNPGSRAGFVTGFNGEPMKERVIREWIRDGTPASRANDPEWQAELDSSVLVMPAFGDILSEDDIDALIALVQSLGVVAEPDPDLAALGRARAEALGCFGCHGPGGLHARPNPGSLKGYIPSWDGPDFPHLVRDRDEFEQWVRNGVSDRIAGSSFSSSYVNRANVKMPGYDEHLEPGDIEALWAYIEWLRAQNLVE